MLDYDIAIDDSTIGRLFRGGCWGLGGCVTQG